MMQKNTKTPFGLYFFLFVIFFPVLILGSFFSQFLSTTCTINDEENLAVINRTLSEIKIEGNDELFIQNKLNYLYGMISEEGLNKKNIQHQLEKFESLAVASASIRFFDFNNELIFSNNSSQEYSGAVKRIFWALSQFEREGKTSLLTQYKPVFKSFMGELNPLDLTFLRSALLKITINSQPAYFYWNIFFDHEKNNKFCGGMIVFFYEKEMQKGIAINNILNSSRYAFDSKPIYGHINKSEPSKSHLPANLPLQLRQFEATTLVELLSKEYFNSKISNQFMGMLFAAQSIDANNFVFAIYPKAKDSSKNLKLLGILILLIYLLATIRQLYLYYYLKGYKLVIIKHFNSILICTASILLLCSLFILSYMQFFLVSNKLKNVEYQKLANLVDTIDETHSDAFYELETKYKNFLHLLSNILNIPDKIYEKTDKMLDLKQISRLFVLTQNGDFAIDYPPEKSKHDFVKKIVSVFAKRLFFTLRETQKSWHEQINSVMLDSFADSISELIGGEESNIIRAFEETDKINNLTLGNREYFIFTSFIHSDKGEKQLMVIWHEANVFSQNYLIENVKHINSRSACPSIIEQDCIKVAMVPINRDTLPYPAEYYKYPFVAKISEQIKSLGNRHSFTAEMDGQSNLVFASPLKNIKKFLLFAHSPMTSVSNAQNHFICLTIALFVVLIILIAIILTMKSKYRLEPK